jgi:hypothetical protein
MADKKTTGRQLSRRDPPQRDPETSGQQPEIKPVVDLLATILGGVQKRVQSNVPPPLEGEAARAVDQFREISAALALQPVPTITLTAVPAQFGLNGGTTKLTWSSTEARKVSIDQQVGEVTPAATGSIEVPVFVTTIFTATAQGACGSATASATVNVQFVE